MVLQQRSEAASENYPPPPFSSVPSMTQGDAMRTSCHTRLPPQQHPQRLSSVGGHEYEHHPTGPQLMYTLNGGHVFVNNVAGSRAPLPGFSSFVWCARNVYCSAICIRMRFSCSVHCLTALLHHRLGIVNVLRCDYCCCCHWMASLSRLYVCFTLWSTMDFTTVFGHFAVGPDCSVYVCVWFLLQYYYYIFIRSWVVGLQYCNYIFRRWACIVLYFSWCNRSRQHDFIVFGICFNHVSLHSHRKKIFIRYHTLRVCCVCVCALKANTVCVYMHMFDMAIISYCKEQWSPLVNQCEIPIECLNRRSVTD